MLTVSCSAIRRAADRLGLARKKRDPPSKAVLCVLALLCALGLALMLATGPGLIHDVAVGAFGGSGGAGLAGGKRREDARRDGRRRPNRDAPVYAAFGALAGV